MQYDLFLFDFDGLLADTERLHYRAYMRMCEAHGIKLHWDFETYCSYVFTDAYAVRTELYKQFPQLFAQEPNWDVLYAEKKKLLLQIMSEEPVPLMPGVPRTLQYLCNVGKISSCCVVTHSGKEVTDVVRRKNPALNLIPNWVTREDYLHPKPAPDAYLKAIALYGGEGRKVIGFEDSLRGAQSLLSAGVTTTVLINSSRYGPATETAEVHYILREVMHFNSFDETFSLVNT